MNLRLSDKKVRLRITKDEAYQLLSKQEVEEDFNLGNFFNVRCTLQLGKPELSLNDKKLCIRVLEDQVVSAMKNTSQRGVISEFTVDDCVIELEMDLSRL